MKLPFVDHGFAGNGSDVSIISEFLNPIDDPPKLLTDTRNDSCNENSKLHVLHFLSQNLGFSDYCIFSYNFPIHRCRRFASTSTEHIYAMFAYCRCSFVISTHSIVMYIFNH